MNSTDRFEIEAQAFYNDTGLMAPGKDAPMGYGIDYDVRVAAWQVWIQAYGSIIDKTLSAVEVFYADSE